MVTILCGGFYCALTVGALLLQDLAESPNLVNDEAMTGGWFIKLEVRCRAIASSALDSLC